MEFDPKIHQRRSIRLKGYDYTQPGAYFVTLVTWQRQAISGEVVDGLMRIGELGCIMQEEWLKTARLRPNIKLHQDEFVVMPNHIHGIIWIVDVGARQRRAPTTEQFGKPVSGSIPTIIRSYKSAVTYRINELRGTRGMPVWQRNFYEHIIRSEVELQKIWDYIDTNPLHWQEDQLHPAAPPERSNRENP